MSLWITLGQTDSIKPLKVALESLLRIFGAFFLQITKGQIQNYVGVFVGNPKLFRLAAVDYKGESFQNLTVAF